MAETNQSLNGERGPSFAGTSIVQEPSLQTAARLIGIMRALMTTVVPVTITLVLASLESKTSYMYIALLGFAWVRN